MSSSAPAISLLHLELGCCHLGPEAGPSWVPWEHPLQPSLLFLGYDCSRGPAEALSQLILWKVELTKTAQGEGPFWRPPGLGGWLSPSRGACFVSRGLSWQGCWGAETMGLSSSAGGGAGGQPLVLESRARTPGGGELRLKERLWSGSGLPQRSWRRVQGALQPPGTATPGVWVWVRASRG